MNFDIIEYWLKNSLWGVILVGAIGSMAALFIVKLINKIYIYFSAKRSKHFYIHGYLWVAYQLAIIP